MDNDFKVKMVGLSRLPALLRKVRNGEATVTPRAAAELVAEEVAKGHEWGDTHVLSSVRGVALLGERHIVAYAPDAFETKELPGGLRQMPSDRQIQDAFGIMARPVNVDVFVSRAPPPPEAAEYLESVKRKVASIEGV